MSLAKEALEKGMEEVNWGELNEVSRGFVSYKVGSGEIAVA